MNNYLETPLNKKKIGVAGCGAMGLPMAENIAKAGFDVVGFDIRSIQLTKGAKLTQQYSRSEFSENTDIVISVVRDWSQTQELCFGDNGLFSSSVYPGMLIISSTLSPKCISVLSDKLPEDVLLIDAPMSGTTFRAKDGTLTFMVGGNSDQIKYLAPLFETMGREINHLGKLGRGMTCKVLNNLLAATSTVAVRQVLEAADYLDFPRDKFLDVAKTSSGATWFGDNIANIDWADESYDPENTIGILEKDVRSLMDATKDKPELDINHFAANIIASLQNL